LRPALIEALHSLDPRSGSTISGFVQSWRSAAQGSDPHEKSAAQGDFCISGLMERPSRTAAQTPGRFWPADPIAQCLNGGHGWLQVKRCRCETDASSPLEHVRKTARDSDLEA
jgi:hypothetical protein